MNGVAMKVLLPNARLDVPADLAALVTRGGHNGQPAEAPALHRLVHNVADVLDDEDVVLIKIGAMRLDQARSYAVARLIVNRLRDEVVERGGPTALTAEFDEPDGTVLAPGEATRTRLPHTDGQSVTFLTPSRLDVPAFDPALRTFSGSGGHTSRRHKPYAGIFIQEPGEGLSITTFYRLFELVVRAYQHQTGEPPSSVDQLAAWLGANIRAADERRRLHGFHYIALSGLLGGDLDPAWELVEYGLAEQPLPKPLLERFPTLDRARRACACGRCTGETERTFCAMVRAALGQGWAEVRQDAEIWVSSERFDLILWNNLAVLHGAIKGGGSRSLAAAYLSTADSAGDEYEAWLSRLWHDRVTTLLRARAGAAS
jgi:hypothetical protein